MTDTVPVLTAPLFDPGGGRVNMELPAGLTVAEIVAASLPAASGGHLPLRVALVTKRGTAIIERQHWNNVRPRPGVRVVIRVLPGKDNLRSVLLVVVAVAAIAAGQLWAAPLAGALGVSAAVAQAGIGLAVTAIGSLLVNALVPPPAIKAPLAGSEGEVNRSYSITGWRNRLSQGDAVPVVFGTHRTAPPFAAISYTEIVGDDQYIRSLFVFGYGPLKLTDFRIGGTSLAEYDEVEIEVREGLSDDQPVTLYPKQVIEDLAGSDLTRPLPRDDAGNVVAGAATEAPVVRYSASNGTSASVIISFPAGLFNYDTNGNLQSLTVTIRIRFRALDSGDSWTDVTTLNISAAKREAFFRQHAWAFPARGRYEIEVTRMTDERTSSRVQDRSVLVAVQTFRPEYPLNFEEPLALAAVRIKATHQLNGALDNLNALCSRICPDWDAASQTWLTRETNNPASLYRFALQSGANAYPVTDEAINLGQLSDWHDYCEAKGLRFNLVLDRDLALVEVLQLIAAAGRASPQHDGVQWTVVIDRPQDQVIDHINPRNSDNFKWQRSYLDPPDAFRVRFFDETNGHEPAERIVPWPGFAGEIALTEEIDLPGKTCPDEVWREARRRQYELTYRPGRYSLAQDGAARVATRGDLVMGSFDTLDRDQIAARVTHVTGTLVVLDEAVTMEDGADYAVRFRTGLSEADTAGVSAVRPVAARAGTDNALLLGGSGFMPEPGTLVHFGRAVSESRPMIVKGIEAGENFTSHLTLLDAAPEIDTLTDQEVPPAWSGVIGSELNDPLLVPAAPVFAAVRTGIAGTGTVDGLDVLVSPGAGSPAVIGSFDIEHRLSGAGSWTVVNVPAGDGGASIAGYASGDSVDLRARALTPSNIPGPYSAVASVTIGSGDAGLPLALGAGSGVSGGVAHAAITIVTQDDGNLAKVAVYRLASGGALDRASHLVLTQAVSRSATFNLVDGDSTGQDPGLLPAGTYDYYLEPQNSDDQPGPIAGPFTATVT